MHFASWDNSKEWRVELPAGEDIMVSHCDKLLLFDITAHWSSHAQHKSSLLLIGKISDADSAKFNRLGSL